MLDFRKKNKCWAIKRDGVRISLWYFKQSEAEADRRHKQKYDREHTYTLTSSRK